MLLLLLLRVDVSPGNVVFVRLLPRVLLPLLLRVNPFRFALMSVLCLCGAELQCKVHTGHRHHELHTFACRFTSTENNVFTAVRTSRVSPLKPPEDQIKVTAVSQHAKQQSVNWR